VEYPASMQDHLIMAAESIPVFTLTWTEVVDHLWKTANTNNDTESIYNLYQIRSLVQKLDSEGFIPFDDSLFTPMAGKQRDQLVDLIDATVESIPGLDTKSLTYGGGKYQYLRFFKFHGTIGGFLMYSADHWMKYQDTPLFFGISRKPWNNESTVPDFHRAEKTLHDKNLTHYSNVEINGSTSFLIPLYVSTGRSKEELLTSLQTQIENLLGLLKSNE